MTRTSDASASTTLQRARLLALLQAGDVDAALQAGLMDHVATGADDAPIQAMQEQLHGAWAARERYRARETRLARLAAEREARRTRATTQATAPAVAETAATTATPASPPLPAAAAAALARARARAAGRDRE